MQLQPVSFNRRVQASGGLYTEQAHKDKEFGLIADDVAKVKPEVCFNDDFGNLAGIHYEQLIAPMLKEIQKLRAEVEALKAKG
jgi:predicted SprT family Zn-dependent metalloprotease